MMRHVQPLQVIGRGCKNDERCILGARPLTGSDFCCRDDLTNVKCEGDKQSGYQPGEPLDRELRVRFRASEQRAERPGRVNQRGQASSHDERLTGDMFPQIHDGIDLSEQ